MKKIFVFVFVLIFLTYCQLKTSKSTFKAGSFESESKADLTISGRVNNGICINCSQ